MKNASSISIDNAALHDADENVSSNPSGNREFNDVLTVAASRRSVLRGSLAGAATAFLAPGLAYANKRSDSALVGFTALTIEQATLDQSMPTISNDYQYQTFIPWGTPIIPGVVAEYKGDPNTRPTPEDAGLQVGIGHDGMWFFPASPGKMERGRAIGLANRRGMLSRQS